MLKVHSMIMTAGLAERRRGSVETDGHPPGQSRPGEAEKM
jgi:hypothetical protein